MTTAPPSSNKRIGVDLGGTKIEAVLLNATGVEIRRVRCAAPRNSYRATLSAIHALVNDVARDEASGAPVGVGIPGAISPATGLVKNANSTWLIGNPFEQDLTQALGRPVRMQNDANCFAVSEATDGAGAGAHIVFAVILGTGVGAGIAIDGQALGGRNAIAGEWGHNPLPWVEDTERPGELCYCGQRGCIETFLSGPSLERDFHRRSGENAGAADIAKMASNGDAAAEATLARYEDRLARSLAHVINMLDPDIIVLGGGVSNIDRWYRTVPALWSRHTFSDSIDTPLRPPVHGDSSGVRGAAWLWPPDEPFVKSLERRT